MTLRLILTRHAKSSWAAAMEDHERPLNLRGEKSALAVGKWLGKRGYVPELALVSSSKRTRQTWAFVSKSFDPTPKAIFCDALYHAEPSGLMEELQKTRANSVMMIAHNPGIAFFAQGLVASLPGDARFERFPTAATAVVDFDAPDWGAVTWNTGRVTDLVFARDLI
ncbi:MAG TPA: phosphoglycerate mutase [Rhodobacteraceae bacterium]|nr:phosphoglycerate mutase [Paracoccaceae bacterium]